MFKKIGFFACAVLVLCICSPSFAAYTGGLSFHFKAVANASKTLSCTSSNSVQTFGAGAASNAPDIILRNTGTKVGYFEIGSSSAVAVSTTSQAINPGEADLLSKEQADSVACITGGSDTTTLIATPGTGN